MVYAPTKSVGKLFWLLMCDFRRNVFNNYAIL